MPGLRRPGRRSFWFLRRTPDAVGTEVDEELGAHLDRRARDLEAMGLSATDARREALRRFGDLDAARAYCRKEDLMKDRRIARTLMITDLIQDTKVCLRGLLHNDSVSGNGRGSP